MLILINTNTRYLKAFAYNIKIMRFSTAITLLVVSVANADNCCTTSDACPSGMLNINADTMVAGEMIETCCPGDGSREGLTNMNACTGVQDTAAAPKDGAITAAIGVALVGVTILVAL